MVIAGSLGWTLVQTHHVGIKPALTLPDRPSREPELDALDRISVQAGLAAGSVAAPGLRETLIQRRRDHAATGSPVQPSSLRH
jgi:hypothetical protein